MRTAHRLVWVVFFVCGPWARILPWLAHVSRRHRSSIQNGRSSVSTMDSAQDADLNEISFLSSFLRLAFGLFFESATRSQIFNYKSPVKINVHMRSQLIQRLSALSALPGWLLCTSCHESYPFDESCGVLPKVTDPFRTVPYYPTSHFTHVLSIVLLSC